MFVLVKYIIPLLLLATLCSADCTQRFRGYEWRKETDHYYKFHNIAETWWRALAVCMQENAYLTVINSPAEANVIKQIYEKNLNISIGSENIDYAHVGFVDWERNNNWYTINDGKPLAESGYTDWADGEPNKIGSETCGSIYKNARLNDIRCMQKAVFICEKDVVSTSYPDSPVTLR